MTRFSIDRTFETVARTIVRFRWLVVVLWLLAAVVVSGAFPSLGSEINNDNSAFLPASAPSSRAADLAAPLLGSSKTTYILLVATRSSGLTPQDLGAISREASAAREVGGVLAVQGPVLSADGHAAQLRVRIEAPRNDISTAKTIVSSLQGSFSGVGAAPGLQFHPAGQIATAVANQTSSNRSGNEIQLFSILFIVVLLLLVFRAPLAAVITLLPAGLALAISTRVIGELGAHGLKISSITQVLLIVLLLGAGTDYGLFLVFRVREELRNGHEGKEAVVRALVRVGESITASAGTVILALLTLLLASFGLYHDLGLPLAVGMAVMLAVGLTLLPALLATFGRAVFWPVRIEPGARGDSGLWGRIAARLVRRPALTLGLGVIMFLALAAAALGFSSSGFGGATSAPAGSDAAAGNALLAAHFPETSSNPANLILAYPQSVWQNPQPLVQAAASLRSSGRFTALSGPLDPNGTVLTPAQLVALHAKLGPPGRLPVRGPASLGVPRAQWDAYRAAAQFVSADGRIAQFAAALRAGGQQSTEAKNATPVIRAAVSEAAGSSGAGQSGVAGEAAALYDISTTANHDLRVIIPIAVLAIGLLLALVLRSLVAPLYLIVSVVLSYLAALGVATIAFIYIGGESGISFILPFLMFVFLFALGEDYNILVMTRIREEARSLPLRDAVVRAVARTGSTVTSAGLILGGTFVVLTVASSGAEAGQVRAIGVGLAAGILMDTFLVRTLLVPATVILLGRWNWWPSAMSRADRPHAVSEARLARPGDPSEVRS